MLDNDTQPAEDGTTTDLAVATEWLERWRLSLDGAVFQTATSTLAPAYTATGQAVMLKISHVDEEQRGSHLLAAWSGHGAARVLEHEGDAVLMERATGPRSLAHLSVSGADAAATEVLCETAAVLHAASADVLDSPEPPELVPLRTWFRNLFSHADEFTAFHRRGADLALALLDDERDVVALHGDVHHANVLDFGERGWLAIDPKGLLGDRAFDYCNLFCNPSPELALEPGRLEARFAQVTDAAALPPDRLARWLVAWCALSSTWSTLDGDDAVAESMIRIGERAIPLALD
ncbi:aminoglycoside phosphotransferase family protein [Agromyces albus]|uniref:aminoglycoside phosphotransferase family protein n=1 Tax=Agromyces albus TaxID=205332 RepID=UPI0027871A9A|nr:aminoglycoside phosphotransferase family protein [Agromyces albus]MDQ0574504.1 streptomycin 6-kinase [Agromyces albus]